MLRGIQENIFALPIHDAVAVEVGHMSWACDAMKDTWEAEMKEIHEGAKAVVSTEIAELLCFQGCKQSRNPFK